MIHNAIQRAYEKFNTCHWTKIYVALDIHGTVANPDYKDVASKLYHSAAEPLRAIAALPEVSIILYSCCYPTDYEKYTDLFNRYGIQIQGFNANREVPNTRTGCFDSKFYFSVLIDDKAGFEPWMWPSVRDAFMNAREFNPRVQQLYGNHLPSHPGGYCKTLRDIYESDGLVSRKFDGARGFQHTLDRLPVLEDPPPVDGLEGVENWKPDLFPQEEGDDDSSHRQRETREGV